MNQTTDLAQLGIEPEDQEVFNLITDQALRQQSPIVAQGSYPDALEYCAWLNKKEAATKGTESHYYPTSPQPGADHCYSAPLNLKAKLAELGVR